MVFHWSLSDSKSPQVFRTLLSILADLNNAEVWRLSALSLISNSTSPLTKPPWIVPSAPITIGITATFMFHNFLVLWQAPSTCLSFRFLLFSICGQPGRQNPLIDRFFFFFFLFTITTAGHLAGIRWTVCMLKSQRIWCVSFSVTDSGLCIHHLVEWSNFNFLHNSPYSPFPSSRV